MNQNSMAESSRRLRRARRLLTASTVSLAVGATMISAPASAYTIAEPEDATSVSTAKSPPTSEGAAQAILPANATGAITGTRSVQARRYELVNDASDLRADVIGASQRVATRVFLWPNNNSGSQEFEIKSGSDGWFRLKAVHSGQCLILDWRSGKYVNGTPIVQHPDCSPGYRPGSWKMTAVPRAPGSRKTKYVLVNRRTGRCLDAANPNGGAPPERALLQQWDCVTRDNAWNIGNQAWELVDVS